jgi:hypothetical protein
LKDFLGYHSEWNLGSPGGWDYQRITQQIAKAVWEKLNQMADIHIKLDFDDPLFYPVFGFTDMLVEVYKRREGNNPGLIAVVAEEETLETVTENANLAKRLDQVDGITGVLAAPHEFEINNGKTCYRGKPVSLIFMDFNNDVLQKLHRKHDLSPVLKAVRDNRVINPRGTEPINIKSMYEVITGSYGDHFHQDTVQRTPWTRRFFSRSTEGPNGETIPDLVEWTRKHWDNLVLKPIRGYSGIGVKVGKVHGSGDDAVKEALSIGNYIVQQKVSLGLWSEDMPELNSETGQAELAFRQTDFRCLMGPDRVFGFLGRFGNVPTNVGSGGGVQPLAVLKNTISIRDAVDQLNTVLMNLGTDKISELVEMQKSMAVAEKFTYLLGPIKIALRPRILTSDQLQALNRYCINVWKDCLTLEKMWEEGVLDEFIDIEKEELEIASMQPWKGGPAIFAADGLFSFGAHRKDYEHNGSP